MSQLPSSIATLLISPHPDDIAYSVGGAVLAGFFERPILMVTVFTRSISALYYDGKRDVRSITEFRTEEDDEFARRIGSSTVRLGLADATLSMQTKSNSFPLVSFSSLLAGFPPRKTSFSMSSNKIRNRIPLMAKVKFLHKLSRFDSSYTLIKARLSYILSKFEVKTLVSPLAIGNHPNHIVTSRACKELCENVSRTFFYEDLPYSNLWRPSQIVKYVSLFDRHLKPVAIDIQSVLDKKIDNLKVYKSQVRLETEHVLRYAARKSLGKGVHERLWSNFS